MAEPVNKNTMISVPLIAVLIVVLGWFFKVTTENQKSISENQKAIAVIAAQFQMYCQTTGTQFIQKEGK